MEPFSNEDIAIEILSRLPICSLLAFKCTATKWNNLISDPSFLRIYHKRSYDVAGIFVQEACTYPKLARPLGPLCFYSLAQNKCRLNLDFLPEKFILVGSSNGIICCRTYKYLSPMLWASTDRKFILKEVELDIYLCDPARKEWITVRSPQGLKVYDFVVFGLASYPFGTSSNKAPSFKLVNVQCPRSHQNVHSFFIYSSDTGKWEKSREVCIFDSEIREDMAMFLNGRLHWSTLDYHLLTFDLENELSKFFKLPCSKGRSDKSFRFGESEGYLHCVCVLTRKLRVWVLKDYDEPVWELKYCLDLLELCLNNASLFETDSLRSLVCNYYSSLDETGNAFINAWSYNNEVLALAVIEVLLIYDFKTRRVIQHIPRRIVDQSWWVLPTVVVQCHANLVPLGNFVRDGVCSKQEGRRGCILPSKRSHESL